MKVLVSGASMAGLSAAYWFDKHGFEVTVVEQFSGLRPGGAPIDIRGEALGTTERMGIMEEARRRSIPVIDKANKVLGEDGLEQATLNLAWFANETSEDFEITRDQLNQLFHASLGDGVDLRFEMSISSLTDRGDDVAVVFSDGTEAVFDLVVGADGLHSNTRRLVFGPESEFVRHKGVYVALLDLDPAMGWDCAMLTVPGAMLTIREVEDRVMAYFMVLSDEMEFDYRDLGEQRLIAAGFLAQLPDVWEVPRLREAVLDPDTVGFYLDSVSQTFMDDWAKGRVVLIGDAAHCAALLSGMGTSLAMTAAEYLAEEVAASPDDLPAAYSRYEARQRPLVDKAQVSMEEGRGLLLPETAQAVDQRNQMLRDVASKAG